MGILYNMIYKNITRASFLERPNRFIASCMVNGEKLDVHVKNTGRCRELLTPNATVYLEKSSAPARKTQYSLIAVEKNGRIINMDSQAPNAAVEEALINGHELSKRLGGEITFLAREKTYRSSRFDFYVETTVNKIFMEVKGVTLEKNNAVMFPDAPTLRGLKHIRELTEASSNGFYPWVVFVIQMSGAEYFTPNKETHPEFAEALKGACNAGVNIAAYDCVVTRCSIFLGRSVEIRL